jgi:predicted TIM-barrel fold metal-dependent hydrolase
MTILQTADRVPDAEQVAIRVVDSDVHPVPKPGMLMDHVPEPWRSKYFLSRKTGSTIFYDPPDYAYAYAMRMDTFPPGGGFPGSEPDFAFEQLILGAGSDIGILEPQARMARLPEASSAMATAFNHWLDREWLDSTHNWHQRWRGSIVAAAEDPAGAAREIETWAGHPYMAQILIRAEPRPSWGDPMYDPVWTAAVKHDIPVSCHLSRGAFETLPMPPVGLPSYNHDFMTTYSLLAANQVMSMVFDGLFDRFPSLRIVFVEHAFSWILPLLWRMDRIHAERSSYLELKRKPSDYVKEHIRFTTQPLDYPEDKTELTRALDWMEAEKILLFSSDYPHWTFDDPKWLVKHLPRESRERIMFRNGIETYHLPETVPALRGQAKPF